MPKKILNPKRKGFGLEVKTFVSKDNKKTFLVFKKGKQYHVFSEVEAKQAAQECGATKGRNTIELWNELWKKP